MRVWHQASHLGLWFSGSSSSHYSSGLCFWSANIVPRRNLPLTTSGAAKPKGSCKLSMTRHNTPLVKGFASSETPKVKHHLQCPRALSGRIVSGLHPPRDRRSGLGLPLERPLSLPSDSMLSYVGEDYMLQAWIVCGEEGCFSWFSHWLKTVVHVEVIMRPGQTFVLQLRWTFWGSKWLQPATMYYRWHGPSHNAQSVRHLGHYPCTRRSVVDLCVH